MIIRIEFLIMSRRRHMAYDHGTAYDAYACAAAVLALAIATVTMTVALTVTYTYYIAIIALVTS